MIQQIGLHEKANETQPREWIGLTVFDVAYAAIACHLGPTLLSARETRLPAVVNQWLQDAEGLAPVAVVFDMDRQLIGTSVPRWKFFKSIREWESWRRAEGFPEEVMTHLTEIRQVLVSMIRDSPDASKRELIERGKAAASDELGTDRLSARLCRGAWWLSVHGDSLRPLDQCSCCQIIYAESRPVHANNPGPYRSLGAKLPLPGQCGESRVAAYRYDDEVSSSEQQQKPRI